MTHLCESSFRDHSRCTYMVRSINQLINHRVYLHLVDVGKLGQKKKRNNSIGESPSPLIQGTQEQHTSLLHTWMMDNVRMPIYSF